MSSQAFGILILILQAAWAMTAPAVAFAQAKPPSDSNPPDHQVIAVVPRDWPPQYSVDDKGNPTGFAIDVMNEIASRAGLRVTYRILENFAAVDKAMREGRGDIIPNSGITSTRLEQFAFTKPVQTSTISIIVRTKTTGIDDLSDLAGHSVGVVKTNVGESIIKPYKNIKPYIFEDTNLALFELLAGHVDAVIQNRSVILALARQIGIEDRIKVVGSPLLEVKRAIRVQKNKPELRAALDKAVVEFVGSPAYQRIYVKWYGKPMPYWTAVRVMWTAGCVLAGLLIVFALWRYRLIVQSNRRIAASEEKFRDLIEGAVPGVLIHRDHKPLFINRSYARIFGYDNPEELLRQPSALDHVAPSERERLKRYAMARLRGDKAPASYEFEGLRKDGTSIWLENRGRVVDWEGAPAIQRTIVDVTEKRRAEAELMLRSSQQAVVAELGQQGLMNENLESVMNTVVTLVAKFLVTDLCSYLEVAPGTDTLPMRAGVGWKPGVVGTVTVSAGPDSLAGFSLKTKEPVVVVDWQTENRFGAVPPILHDHGVVSSITVIIGDPDKPFGVLAAHTTKPRAFSEDDVLFLKTIAVMLASAISRKHADTALRASEERLRGAIESLQEGFALFDADDRLVAANDQYLRISPTAVEVLRHGGTFEDIFRANVEKKLIAHAVGREEDAIRERLARHRNPKGPITMQWTNGKVYLIKENRTPDGGIAVTINDVTELKRAEEALRASEGRLRGAIESLQEGFALFDANDRLVMINDVYRQINSKAQEMLEQGATFERLIRASVASGLITDAVGREETFIRERLAQHRNPKGSIIRRHSDGKWLIIKETRTPEGGTAITFTDISNVKRADQALSETQQRFQIVVDNLPMGISVKDIDGRYVLANKRYEEWYGVSAGDIVGKRPEDVSKTLEATSSARISHEKSVIHSKSVISRQDRTLWVDGQVHDIEVIKFPVLDPDGKLALIGSVTIDVTERERAEKALRNSEALFRAVINHSPTKIHIKDVEGRYTLINKEAEKLFGVTDDEGRGKTSHDLFPKDLADAFVTHDQAVIESRKAIEHEEEFAVDGEEHTFLTVKFPIFDGDRVTAVGAIGTDISKRKQEEQKLSELQAELAHVSRISTMGEMAAGLAHELNQPLTAITNYAKGTLRRMKSGQGNAANLLPVMELVAEQALRAGEIIRKIRGFMNRSEPQKSRIDLGATINEAITLMAGEINLAGIEVIVDVPKSLPLIMVDSIQVQQVLLNLIRNAVSAMNSDGADHHRLEIGAAVKDGNVVEVYVKDDGPGIPTDIREFLFDPFFTTKSDGLGMGLSISRTIINSHAGRIWVSSGGQTGTTVHFTLPLEEALEHAHA